MYKVTKAAEAYKYEAPLHYDVRTTRLHDADDVNGQITLGLSHFLPGGGAEMGKVPKELVYYIIEGEMTITTDDDVRTVLRKGDSIHFGPDQGRSCKNTGIVGAQMLVVACPSKGV
jgi:uncharacterized cupin superfamily protein